MKKKIIMLCMGCFLVSLTAKAQWVVTDPTNLAQGIINAAKNIVQTSTTATNMINNFQETVKIYKQGKEFYDGLRKVKNLVRDARKVQQTILMVGDITDIYVNSFERMLSDPYFTPEELSAIALGYTKLLEESAHLLNDLKTVVNENGLSMNDKERMDIIDRCYNDMLQYRSLVQYYTNKNIGVSYLRAKKRNDLDRVYEPKRQRGDECWYLAPYREELTASFQVNIRKNVWHDFGTGRGGDIFTLAEEFVGSNGFKEQADFITRIYGGLAPERKTVFRPKENGKDNPDERECMTDIRFRPLNNKVLLRYLEERGICSDVALPNCEEVRYSLHGKQYFAIGFRNRSGGYELRNRFFKGSLSPKDISLTDNGSDTCNLFEGFIDYLSWMVLGLGCGEDCLVLNSVALLERSVPVLDRYEKINCYLDRDEAGRRTLEALRKRYGNRIEDRSALYKGFKDLNEYLQNRLPQD